MRFCSLRVIHLTMAMMRCLDVFVGAAPRRQIVIIFVSTFTIIIRLLRLPSLSPSLRKLRLLRQSVASDVTACPESGNGWQ